MEGNRLRGRLQLNNATDRSNRKGTSRSKTTEECLRKFGTGGVILTMTEP